MARVVDQPKSSADHSDAELGLKRNWRLAMRPKRIVIYGGTDLREPATRWVKHLVRAILAYPDTVIVTGGIVGAPGNEGDTTPTDVAVTSAGRSISASAE
jgi:hypothetical protein